MGRPRRPEPQPTSPCGAWETACRVHHAGRSTIPKRASPAPAGMPDAGQGWPDATISKMVRELGIGAVPHGFRSSFRDWAAECSDAPREVCELALAHVNSDRVEAAYRRTDLFERRRELMEGWSAFLDRS